MTRSRRFWAARGERWRRVCIALTPRSRSAWPISGTRGDPRVSRFETDETWVETVLRQHLKRVTAPDELWDRVALPRVETRRPSLWLLAAASALTASVFAAAWGYYPRSISVSEFELL